MNENEVMNEEMAAEETTIAPEPKKKADGIFQQMSSLQELRSNRKRLRRGRGRSERGKALKNGKPVLIG